MNTLIYENCESILLILKQAKLNEELLDADEEKLCMLFNVVIDVCSVKPLHKSEDIPYSVEDFENVAQNALPILLYIQKILSELIIISNLKIATLNLKKKIVIGSLTISLQYQKAECFWSSKDCAIISNKIIESLCELTTVESTKQLLTGRKDKKALNDAFPSGILKPYFEIFCQKVTKNTWKKYPAYISSYLWILCNIDCIESDYLPYLLPPALFILDDWQLSHKVIGIKALHHILQSAPGSELRWHGRAEVIFDALNHNLLTREEDVLEVAYPAAILGAQVMESDPKCKSCYRKKSFDALLERLLSEMAHEQKLTLRSIYVNALKRLTEAMGIFAIRWSKVFLEVCGNYLSTFEGENGQDRLVILQTLEIFVKNCWPRIHDHAEVILKMILKITYDLAVDDPPTRNKECLCLKMKDIVSLLYEASPHTLEKLSFGLQQFSFSHQKEILFVFSEIPQ